MPFVCSVVADGTIEEFESKDIEFLQHLVTILNSVKPGDVSDAVYEFVEDLRRGKSPDVDTRIVELNQEIAELKGSVAEKDEKIKQLGSRMKECQDQFADFVQAVHEESNIRSRRLDDMAAVITLCCS
jgi:DNA anti-recombination protein RmuC